MRFRPKWQKITYTTHTYPSKLVPSTYLRRKIGIYVHNITPRPLSRTRRTPINLPKSVLEHCVITDLKHTVGGSAKVLLLSISPYCRQRRQCTVSDMASKGGWQYGRARNGFFSPSPPPPPPSFLSFSYCKKGQRQGGGGWVSLSTY